MKLTKEQNDILTHKGDLCIRAMAGSGKTTTLIELARAWPITSKILYIAFNKSVKEEASNRFLKEKIPNVKVDTAHSLAYRFVVPKLGYKVKSTGYKPYEIVSLLGIKSVGGHDEYVLSNHILRYFSLFCNSTALSPLELDYVSTLDDIKVITHVQSLFSHVQNGVKKLWELMNDNKIEVTHDFYLKKFQLLKPCLPYDLILFDEGQDASAAMLDIFYRQNCTHVIVGDSHQQIYGWRFAVDSLKDTSFTKMSLTQSFRFNQEIAGLALMTLRWKNHFGQEEDVKLSGTEKGPPPIQSKAILARGNLALLLKALDMLENDKGDLTFHFEGNLNTYMFADDGTSLYDVLNLYQGKNEMIRDPMLRRMNSIDDLEDYIEKTGDRSLAIMVEIVKKYKGRIPYLLRELKNRQVGEGERLKADYIFSTVHKCKGMEYDQVELLGDFITEERLKEWLEKGNVLSIQRLNEEINLLYVAITRTRHFIILPNDLFPGIDYSNQIINPALYGNQSGRKRINRPERKAAEQEILNRISDKKARLNFEKILMELEMDRIWTREQDKELKELFEEGYSPDIIAEIMEKDRRVVEGRIYDLGLDE